jgi:hypothetical protein
LDRIEDFFCVFLRLLDKDSTNGYLARFGSAERRRLRLAGGVMLPFALDPKYLGYLPQSDDDDAFAVGFEWKNGVERRLRETQVQYPLHMLFDFYRKLAPPAAHATFAETLECSLSAENSKQVLKPTQLLKFATDFDIVPLLLGKEKLFSIYKAASKKVLGAEPSARQRTEALKQQQQQIQRRRHRVSRRKGGHADTPQDPSRREGGSASGVVVKQHMCYDLPEEPDGFRVFADSLVRVAEEAFSQERFRLAGLYGGQDSKLQALFHYMEIDDERGSWQQKRKVFGVSETDTGQHRNRISKFKALLTPDFVTSSVNQQANNNNNSSSSSGGNNESGLRVSESDTTIQGGSSPSRCSMPSPAHLVHQQEGRAQDGEQGRMYAGPFRSNNPSKQPTGLKVSFSSPSMVGPSLSSTT